MPHQIFSCGHQRFKRIRGNSGKNEIDILVS
jgi:hypothetical protein